MLHAPREFAHHSKTGAIAEPVLVLNRPPMPVPRKIRAKHTRAKERPSLDGEAGRADDTGNLAIAAGLEPARHADGSLELDVVFHE